MSMASASASVTAAPLLPIPALSSSAASSHSTAAAAAAAVSFPRFPPLRLSVQHRRPLPCLLHRAAAARDDEAAITAGPADPTGRSRTKLFVASFPDTYSASDLTALFSQTGAVKDLQFVADKTGKSKAFAFVTMDTKEEAEAAISRFDSHELLGRIIRVEYAKNLKKLAAARPPAVVAPAVPETRYLVYVSNLAWKVRSNNLKDFVLSAGFKPVSSRVVFDSPSGRAAGYGFVAFATEEEAKNAVSELNGKELMGRPLRLKISEKKRDEAEAAIEVKGADDAKDGILASGI